MNYRSDAVPANAWRLVEVGSHPKPDDPLRRKTVGPCWEWRGSRTRKGYGKFWAHSDRLGRKALRQAHVCFWEWEHGEPLPSGRQVDHLCRNPGCVNPAHLEMVTPKVNVGRGRGPQFARDLAAAGKSNLQRPEVRAKAMAALLLTMPEQHQAAYLEHRAWRAIPVEERKRIGRERNAATQRTESQRAKRRGQRNVSSRLKDDDVRTIRAAKGTGESGVSVASRFNISESMVRAIWTGRKWGWLP